MTCATVELELADDDKTLRRPPEGALVASNLRIFMFVANACTSSKIRFASGYNGFLTLIFREGQICMLSKMDADTRDCYRHTLSMNATMFFDCSRMYFSRISVTFPLLSVVSSVSVDCPVLFKTTSIIGIFSQICSSI